MRRHIGRQQFARGLSPAGEIVYAHRFAGRDRGGHSAGWAYAACSSVHKFICVGTSVIERRSNSELAAPLTGE